MNLTKIAAAAFVTFGLSGNVMAEKSNLSQDGYDLAEAKQVMKDDLIDAKGLLGKLVSVNYILEHGEVPLVGNSIIGINLYSVDFDIDDEYNRALKEIENNVMHGIENSSSDGVYNRYDEVSLILNKENWAKSDYIDFERNLFSIISYEMSQISGLKSYRSNYMGHQVEASSNLNDLSIDIKNGTATVDFDCDSMSITEAVIAHRVKSRLLDDNLGQENDNYRIRGKDYIALGLSRTAGNNKGQHAVILSGVTGNLIEGVHLSSLDINKDKNIWNTIIERSGSNGAYKELLNKNPIADFINGKPIFTSNGDIFGSSAANIHNEKIDNYIPDYVDLQIRIGSASIREVMVNTNNLIDEYKKSVDRLDGDPRIAYLAEIKNFDASEKENIHEHDDIAHYISTRDTIISAIEQIHGVLKDKDPLNIGDENLRIFRADLSVQISYFIYNYPEWGGLSSTGDSNDATSVSDKIFKLSQDIDSLNSSPKIDNYDMKLGL